MRVQIDHSEKQTGLFSKTTHYVVTTHVQFSEEEKHVIQSRKLQDRIVMERLVPSDFDPSKYEGMEHIFNLTIGRLMNGPDKFALEAPSTAKEYEAELTMHLKELKEFIDANAETQKSTSFEL